MGRTLRKEPELELNPQTLLLDVSVLTTGLNACSRTKVYASLYFHCISLYKYQNFFLSMLFHNWATKSVTRCYPRPHADLTHHIHSANDPLNVYFRDSNVLHFPM